MQTSLDQQEVRGSFLSRFIFFTVTQFVGVFLRFPLPSIFSALFCTLAIIVIHYPSTIEYKYFEILFLGCLWFISWKLYVENNRISLLHYYLVGVPVFLIIACLYIGIKIGDVAIDKQLDFYSLGLALFLSMFIAPFIFQKNSSPVFWQFSHTLFWHILFTILVSIVFGLGICLIMYAIYALFIRFAQEISMDLLMILATFLAPMIAMSGIPQNYFLSQEHVSKKLRFILAYIMLPCVLIYAAIIHAYFIKILSLSVLPKGIISSMSLALGFVGIVCYLINYPLRDSGGIFSFFQKHFFKIILIPSGLGLYALWLRIDEYGITEFRYITIVYLMWVLSSALFVLLKGRDDAPRFLVISLVCLLVVSSIGPLRASKVSEYSQIHRLESILKNNGILIDGKLKVLDHELDRSTHSSICSIFDYFMYRNKKVLTNWLSGAAWDGLYNSADAKDIVESFGLKCWSRHGYLYGRQNLNANKSQSVFWKNYQIDSEAITIKGYDYYLNLNNPNILNTYFLDRTKDSFIKLSFDSKSNSIEMIFPKSSDPIKVDCSELAQKIVDKSFTNDDSVIVGKSIGFDWKLIISNISGSIGNLQVSGILLIKVN
jgi:hypothetical protein